MDITPNHMKKRSEIIPKHAKSHKKTAQNAYVFDHTSVEIRVSTPKCMQNLFQSSNSLVVRNADV